MFPFQFLKTDRSDKFSVFHPDRQAVVGRSVGREVLVGWLVGRLVGGPAFPRDFEWL